MKYFIVELVLMVALLAAFIVLLVKKWGVAEWMQIHGDHLSQRWYQPFSSTMKYSG